MTFFITDCLHVYGVKIIASNAVLHCLKCFKAGVTKLQPMGCIRPINQFNLACQKLFTFFSSATFLSVDRRATALAAAYHANRTVSDPPVARQFQIQPSGKKVWPPMFQINLAS